MAVANVVPLQQALLQIQSRLTELAGREPDVVKAFAEFLEDDRHGSYTFVSERGKVYDGHWTTHARRRGSRGS